MVNEKEIISPSLLHHSLSSFLSSFFSLIPIIISPNSLLTLILFSNIHFPLLLPFSLLSILPYLLFFLHFSHLGLSLFLAGFLGSTICWCSCSFFARGAEITCYCYRDLVF